MKIQYDLMCQAQKLPKKLLQTSWAQYCVTLIFVLCLGVHLYYSFIGWNHTLDDYHGFRQTQTAISTFYIIKDGFTLKYLIPVLGAPWALPYEFPLYQWTVALLVILFKTPLDQTGRFVSLLFFYLSLLPLYSVLGYILKRASYRLSVLSLVLLNPIYLFWSRTFMIESLALFLSLAFIWAIARLLERKQRSYFLGALLAGILAGLAKITTFVAWWLPALLLFVFFWRQEPMRYSRKVLIRYGFYGLCSAGIPLLVASLWVQFADYQKSLNPIASIYLTSQALTQWNFGTWQQRLSLATWQRIFEWPLVIDRGKDKFRIGSERGPEWFRLP
jgi:hypothetical protein